VLALFDAQAARVRGLMQVDEEALILGDGGRVGALGPAPVAVETMRWVTSLAATAYLTNIAIRLTTSNQTEQFGRQAVASDDSRTTECCRRVDGQIVGMNEPFRLTGTPRYADQKMAPPFHDHCRTSVALVKVR